MAEPFGALLRELRVAAGISMGQLAKRVNYSKSYLSKIENELKPPNATLARLCDSSLDAGGRLIDAARAARDAAPTLDRRQVLAAGTAFGFALAGGPRPAPDERVIVGMRTLFEQLRGLATQTSPAVVLDPLMTHVRTVRALAEENPEPIRGRLLLLAARVAEHTGWMHQELGDDAGALSWTRHSADLAHAGGDREIGTYALVREACLALHRHDPETTIALAARAQLDPRAGARTLALAARREAQGHALAGDRGNHDRAMDRAHALIDSAPAESGAYPVLGSTAPNVVELARGYSLFDLGQVADAAAVLDRELPRVPATSRRTAARFGARRSLAHALAGEVDQACATLPATLEHAAQVDSATVRVDLRDLARTLNRWRTHAAVKEVYPALVRVLHRTH